MGDRLTPATWDFPLFCTENFWNLTWPSHNILIGVLTPKVSLAWTAWCDCSAATIPCSKCFQRLSCVTAKCCTLAMSFLWVVSSSPPPFSRLLWVELFLRGSWVGGWAQDCEMRVATSTLSWHPLAVEALLGCREMQFPKNVTLMNMCFFNVVILNKKM